VITPLAAAVLMALAAAIAGVGAYWSLRFGELLPLRRRMRELEKKAGEWSREVSALHEVSDAVSERSLQDQSTLGAIVTIAAQTVGADLGAALLLDEGTGDLVTQPGAFGLEFKDLYRVSLLEDASSSVRVFKTRQPFWTGNAQQDPGVIAQYAKLWKIHSLLAVPMRREGRCIGVLRLGSYKRDFFTADHAQLLGIIADEAAILVETAVLNRRLAETAEQLKALNRMKDEFVSTVSHEFKTPLATLNGFLSVLVNEEAGPLEPQQKKFLGLMETAVKRMIALVIELLDLSKLEGGAPMDLKPLAIESLVRSSVERHTPQAQDGGRKLAVDVPAGLPEVRGDSRWLPVVVDNLIANAIKFTHPGGRIAVSAQPRGEFVVISVADDGIGVPDDERDRIFERFHRASNSRDSTPGTGLGLAIAREIVHRHGGKIWCEAGSPKGTRFSFVIPVDHAMAGVA
jgi:signal transduction histidine kinase